VLEIILDFVFDAVGEIILSPVTWLLAKIYDLLAELTPR
jgi:hypothetical protein